MTVVDGAPGAVPAARPSWAERALHVLPPVVLATAAAVTAARSLSPVSDPDAWWHLRLGDDLLRQGDLAAPDWGRFATRPWAVSEPLPELLTRKVEAVAGLPGVATLYAASLLVVVAILYLLARRLADPLAASVSTAVALVGASGSLTQRPQLVSFALLALVVLAWLGTERDLVARWWLVPLTWFWSLCHGFWFLGVAFSALACLGVLLGRRRDLAPRDAVRLLLVPVLSFAVVALSPAGPGVLVAPLAVSDTQQYISEWQHPTFHEQWTIAAVVMVVLTVVCWVVRRRTTWVRVLLLVAAAFLVWYARRTIAVSAVVLLPVLADALQRLIDDPPSSTPHPAVTRRLRPLGRREVVALVGWCVACLVVVGAVAPTTSSDPGDVPTGLDPGLDALPAGTVVWNTYDVGGWLAWRHDDLTRVIDGLIVPYPNAFVDAYFTALRGQDGWQQTVAATGATWALLHQTDGLTHRLMSAGWTASAPDDGYVLLHAPDPSRG